MPGKARPEDISRALHIPCSFNLKVLDVAIERNVTEHECFFKYRGFMLNINTPIHSQ